MIDSFYMFTILLKFYWSQDNHYNCYQLLITVVEADAFTVEISIFQFLPSIGHRFDGRELDFFILYRLYTVDLMA